MSQYVEEQHAREQYFFDPETLKKLADFVARFERPCCLCAPMIGRELQRRRRSVRVLDVDERFIDLPGFVRWDLFRPTHLNEEFDLICCDPPFFNVSLSQLFKGIRLLCSFDLTRKVMISYPVRRRDAILSVFAPLGLRDSGWRPRYLTVQHCERNEVEFYANFDLGIESLSMGCVDDSD
jgi:hypothetical protein